MKTDSREGRVDFIEFPTDSVQKLDRAKVFYQAVFGWSFQGWGDAYCDTKSSGVGSGINADSEHRSSAPLVVIYAAELEKLRSRVVEAGGKITRDIFSFPGGRRFHYQDPAGNELAIWSDK